jgi:hypothetical protein
LLVELNILNIIVVKTKNSGCYFIFADGAFFLICKPLFDAFIMIKMAAFELTELFTHLKISVADTAPKELKFNN